MEYSCDACGNDIDGKLGRYACIPCEYDVCQKCWPLETSATVDVNELIAKLGGMLISGQAKQDKIKEGQLCNMCCMKPVNAAFCPCGHAGSCYDCSQMLKKCPFCNGKIESVLKLFIA